MKPNLRLVIFSLSITLLTWLTACQEEDQVVRVPENGLTADAGDDIHTKVNEPIVIDGTGSNDKFNKPFNSRWTMMSKPPESAAIITEATTLTPGLMPDKVGVYILKLKITQGEWFSEDEVIIYVTTGEQPNEPQTVIISENINSDRTLTNIFDDATPDYIVTGDIEVRGNLTIEPGVIISFQENKSLQMVEGSVSAKGTAEKGILFKGQEEWPGYWKGIVIHSNSLDNEFDYVTVRHGASNPFPGHVTKANITLEGTNVSGAALKLSNSKILGAAGYGLYVRGMSSIENFTGNQFSGNLMVAYIPAGQLGKIDETNVAQGNGFNGVETGGETSQQGEVVWKKMFAGLVRVTSDIKIRHGVTVQPGLTFNMSEGVTIRVIDGGYLNAQGTSSSNIVFDAMDVNKYWNGIYFNTFNENNNLVYTKVVHAGKAKIADAEYAANVYVGFGLLDVQNSSIADGLGYGIVTKYLDRLNENVAQVNTFSNLVLGPLYPKRLQYPDMPSVLGVWVDEWTLKQGTTAIVSNFYNKTTGVWFGGAANPWEMNNAGFGLRFDDYGTFTWNIAENHPWVVGCQSYSAEMIQGSMVISETTVSFSIQYWRSKFVNSCDETQNVDTNVETYDFVLPYEITKLYDLFSGEPFWELKFTNPDGTTFSLFRK